MEVTHYGLCLHLDYVYTSTGMKHLHVMQSTLELELRTVQLDYVILRYMLLLELLQLDYICTWIMFTLRLEGSILD